MDFWKFERTPWRTEDHSHRTLRICFGESDVWIFHVMARAGFQSGSDSPDQVNAHRCHRRSTYSELCLVIVEECSHDTSHDYFQKKRMVLNHRTVLMINFMIMCLNTCFLVFVCISCTAICRRSLQVEGWTLRSTKLVAWLKPTDRTRRTSNTLPYSSKETSCWTTYRSWAEWWCTNRCCEFYCWCC